MYLKIMLLYWWNLQDVRQLIDDIKELKPTVFCSVPRVLDKIYSGESQKLTELHRVLHGLNVLHSTKDSSEIKIQKTMSIEIHGYMFLTETFSSTAIEPCPFNCFMKVSSFFLLQICYHLIMNIPSARFLHCFAQFN